MIPPRRCEEDIRISAVRRCSPGAVGRNRTGALARMAERLFVLFAEAVPFRGRSLFCVAKGRCVVKHVLCNHLIVTLLSTLCRRVTCVES